MPSFAELPAAHVLHTYNFYLTIFSSFHFSYSIILLMTLFLNVKKKNTVLVPLHYIDQAYAGFVYLPTLGIGAVIAAPLLLLLQVLTSKTREFPKFHVKETLLMGTLSGFIWNVNNICVIGAIPRIGYGVAFPVAQCAIFIGGSWGIWVFKEMVGWAIPTFYASAIILITGAVMLSIAGEN